MELMRRVYRLFRKRLWEDLYFHEETREQIMKQLNTAIYEAQAEIYKEVTKDDP